MISAGYTQHNEHTMDLDIAAMTKSQMEAWYPKISSAHGFTKVYENESNAVMVYLLLIALSKKFPKATITLYDEGTALTFDHIVIQNGRTLIDYDAISENIKYHSVAVATMDFELRSMVDLSEIEPSILRDINISPTIDLDSIQRSRTYLAEELEQLRNFERLMNTAKLEMFHSVHNLKNFLGELNHPVLTNPLNFIKMDVLRDYGLDELEPTMLEAQLKAFKSIFKMIGDAKLAKAFFAQFVTKDVNA